MLISTIRPPAASVGLEHIQGNLLGSVLGAHGVYPRRHFIPKLIEPFDSSSEWVSAIRLTPTNDTTNYVCSAASTPQSVKFTKETGGTSSQIHKVITETDLSNTLVYVRFYVHEGSGTSKWDKIDKIYFTVADSTYANFQMLLLADSSDITGPGWYERTIAPKMGDMTAGTYTLCWEHVTRLRVQVYSVGADDTPAVTFDQTIFIPQLSKSKYAITLDDSKDTDYKYAAYLISKGIKSTLFVIPSKTGTAGNLTLDQLHKIHNAGHLIANHGWESKFLLADNLTETEFAQDITKATEWLCDNGFADGARIFALPGGSSQWKNEFNDKYRNRWFDLLRLTDARHNVGFYDPTIQWADALDNTTKADSQVDDTINAGTIVVTGWHSFNEGSSFTWADWKAHIDNVAAKRDAGDLEVVTMADLLGVGV